MAAGKINLQANDGKVLGLYAPDGMSANTDIVPASVNGDASQQFKVADAVNGDEAVSKAQHDLKANLSDFVNSIGTNGYQKLPNGLIIQYGFIDMRVTSSGSIVFPIAFPSNLLSLIVGPDDVGNGVGWSALSDTGFNWTRVSNISSTSYYIAVGN